ncbi:MAG TPA: fructose-bisphosphate aldolase class I [Candidatus Magasanikbacteria bacterium]|nr:fructose-bisphosphate aldolase class I [Candidatus Magasanikbacteria bacterium]
MTIQEITKSLVAPGKGILAADESTGTIQKRFDSIGVESTEEMRRAYRELLFTAPGMGDYISGVILYDETIRQRASDGHTFVTVLEKQGVVPGIKVDLGTESCDGSEIEKCTKGLEGLDERLKEYYNLGARFAKWRAVITIGEGIPTDGCIAENAKRLAQYAKYVQEAGMVPIVEPEVLMDGDHDIDRCYEVTKKTLGKVFEELRLHGVALDGMLLKPNMVIPGKGSPKSRPEEIAEKTIACFIETVPAEVPGIVFLSGGQSEKEACENLNAINTLSMEKPWELSFSYGRALQASTLDTWHGKEDQVGSAQEVFLHRAKLASAARSGIYSLDIE